MNGECYVCGRWGTGMVRVSASNQRHEDCAPGSEPWLDYYERLPASKRTEAGRFLYEHRRGIKAKA